MPLETKTISVEYPAGQPITITVQEANLVAGMRRGRLINQLIYSTDIRFTDPDLANVYAIYCDLIGGTVEVQGMDWPLPVEEFLELADRWFDVVGVQWLRAIQSLNPNWMPSSDTSSEEDDSGEAESAAE